MSSEFKNTILSNYKIKKILGKGTFSTVKLAINKETGEEIAIKILDKNKIKNNRDIKRIEREISMVKNINHPNIAKVYEIKEDEEKIYILMEYCENGELFNLILERHKLTEEESAYFYYQIINGLEYIHAKNIIHRDLKPENLLLTKNNILKIIDFGLSNYNTNDNLLSTPCGSPCYASPEMVSGNKYNGFTSDVWSTGIILYAMIYGYLPFENINNNNDVLFRKISECKIDYPRNSCVLALDLLKKILIPDFNERIKICDIKKHNFYLKGKSIFSHKHKDLNIYKNIETRILNNSDNNNIYIKEKSRETKNNNYSSEKKYNNKSHEKIESDNIYNNNAFLDDIDEDSNKKKEKILRYKNKKITNYSVEKNLNEKFFNNITSKKTMNSFHKNPVEDINQILSNEEDDYFSQLNKKTQKRYTYCDNINNNSEIKNNLYNINSTQKKNNYNKAPKIKIDTIKNFDEESKNESKLSKNKIEKIQIKNKNLIITKALPSQKTTKNIKQNIKIEIIPPSQTGENESIIIKNIKFTDKYPNLNLNTYPIENGNKYIYKALSNLKRISPLNFHNKKNIKIILNNDNKNNINNVKRRKKESSKIIISQNDDMNLINSDNNIINRTENTFNKNRKKENDDNINKNLQVKKYSFSVQKNRNIGNKKKVTIKNISTSKNNNFKNSGYLNEIEESKDDSKKESFEEESRSKSNKNKNSDLNNYSKFNTNSNLKDIGPISIINFKPNNSFLICTPSSKKKDLNFESLKKIGNNPKKFDKKNTNSNNYSFNNEIKQNDKIYSLNNNSIINNKIDININSNNISQINNNIYNININSNNKSKEKNGYIKKNNQINSNYLTRNNNEIKTNLNNNIVFSSSYKVKHTNNKSLEDSYFNNKNNINNKVKYMDKNPILENNEKIHIINQKSSDKNKRNNNINNNYNNTFLKIITDTKKEINSKKLQKKYSTSVENAPGPKYTRPNTNNINKPVINYQKVKNNNEKELEKENKIKEKEIKDGHKYFNEKKDNLRLSLNKINNNKISDNYLTKINYSNKINNSNDINRGYNLENKEDNNDIYNTERKEMINSIVNEKYNYINRNSYNKNMTNNNVNNEKKENNNNKEKIINEDIKINEINNNINSNNNISISKKDENNEIKKNKILINTSNLIANIGKINLSSLPSITIDMNILNKNNMKYLKFYDSIKNKL